MELSEILMINLKVVSHLDPHVKLDTGGTLYRAYSQYFVPTWTLRWWQGRSRAVDINKIHQLYVNCIELIETAHKDSERLKEDMQASIKGLKNLKMTYQDDITITSQIEVILSKVNEICGTQDTSLPPSYDDEHTSEI